MANSVKVLDTSGKPGGEIQLPGGFSTPLRPDIVQRAWWILNSHGLQPYGRDPMAGERTGAEASNPATRRGVSRMPRGKGGGKERGGQGGVRRNSGEGRVPAP